MLRLKIIMALILLVIVGCSTGQRVGMSSFIDGLNGKPSSRYHYSHLWKVFHVDRKKKVTYYKCKVCTAWKPMKWAW